MDFLKKVLQQYPFYTENIIIEPLSSGLINSTWKVIANDTAYILQQVNTNIFKQPELIDENLKLLKNYLAKEHPNYLLPTPVASKANITLVKQDEENYYRIFPFVPGSVTHQTLHNEQEAYEAAKQFGNFTAQFQNFNANQLKITLPNFHNLSLRYQQFTQALKEGNAERIKACEPLINYLQQQESLCHTYEKITQTEGFKLRVTHHDCKISNVLFNAEGKALCVIDLDTVMPGYFISDIGDMVRTYVCPVSEEEKDFTKITIRPTYFKAIYEGYNSSMQHQLTETERPYFFYAGAFMIYMQALRFLTDYLNNDIYYSITYADQNFIRAGNQIELLKKFFALQETLESYQ